MPTTEKVQIFGKNDAGTSPSIYARDQIEKFLSDSWKGLFNFEDVSVDDDFFDLGGDSLIAVQLFTVIKKEYGIEFGLSLLLDAPTIQQLAECICNANQADVSLSEQSSLLVPPQPRGARSADDRPVYGFQVDPPEDSVELDPIEHRAVRLIVALRTAQPRGPYRLMGFCGGGPVAFEMAQQLSALGEQVQFLGIVDCVDPQHPRNWTEKLRFNSERAVWRAGQFLSRGPVGCVGQISHRAKLLGENRFPNAVRLKNGWTGTPLPLISQDSEDAVNKKASRSARLYFPKSYNGSCVAFIDAHTYHYAGLSDGTDPRLIWCRLSQGNNEVKRIPGDHLAMLREPNVFEFAKQINFFL